jgi:phage protein D
MMAEQRVTLAAPAADLMRQLTAQRDSAKATWQQAEITYSAVLNALAGEHGMTDPGTVEITADAVVLVLPEPPLPEQPEATDGV